MLTAHELQLLSGDESDMCRVPRAGTVFTLLSSADQFAAGDGDDAAHTCQLLLEPSDSKALRLRAPESEIQRVASHLAITASEDPTRCEAEPEPEMHRRRRTQYPPLHTVIETATSTLLPRVLPSARFPHPFRMPLVGLGTPWTPMQGAKYEGGTEALVDQAYQLGYRYTF